MDTTIAVDTAGGDESQTHVPAAAAVAAGGSAGTASPATIKPSPLAHSRGHSESLSAQVDLESDRDGSDNELAEVDTDQVTINVNATAEAASDTRSDGCLSRSQHGGDDSDGVSAGNGRRGGRGSASASASGTDDDIDEGEDTFDVNDVSAPRSRPGHSNGGGGAGGPDHESLAAFAALHQHGRRPGSRVPTRGLVRQRDDDSRMFYTYGVVLNNHIPVDDGPAVYALKYLQEQIVLSLLRTELQVMIMDVDKKRGTGLGTSKVIVLLVSAESQNDEVLLREHHLLQCERCLKAGMPAPTDDLLAAHNDYESDIASTCSTMSSEDAPPTLTRAMRVYLTHLMVKRAIERAQNRREFKEHLAELRHLLVFHATTSGDDQRRHKTCCGITCCCKESATDFEVVRSHFPVHDLSFNELLWKKMWKRKNIAAFFDLSDIVQMINEEHGSRLAFYFGFINAYTRALLPLTVFTIVYYCALRFTSWGWYVRGLTILGMAVPTLWAPWTLKWWERQRAELAFDWGLMDMPEIVNENPHNPKFVEEYDEELKMTERRYDPNNNRTKIRILMIPFAIFNLILLVLVAMPFVQWYVYGKLAPTCNCCNWFVERDKPGSQWFNTTAPEECEVFSANADNPGYKTPESCTYFLTCFNALGGTVGTDRWLYILIQGVILGIALDVGQFELFVGLTDWLTKLESWPTDTEFERRLIQKQFVFLWVNMYFWFLFIAFLYVPFGGALQQLFIDVGLGNIVPGHGWRAGVINIDEAFVTPLIVTQAINLALETLGPYLSNKAELRASRTRREVAKIHFTKSLRSGSRRATLMVKGLLTPTLQIGARARSASGHLLELITPNKPHKSRSTSIDTDDGSSTHSGAGAGAGSGAGAGRDADSDGDSGATPMEGDPSAVRAVQEQFTTHIAMGTQDSSSDPAESVSTATDDDEVGADGQGGGRGESTPVAAAATAAVTAAPGRLGTAAPRDRRGFPLSLNTAMSPAPTHPASTTKPAQRRRKAPVLAVIDMDAMQAARAAIPSSPARAQLKPALRGTRVDQSHGHTGGRRMRNLGAATTPQSPLVTPASGGSADEANSPHTKSLSGSPGRRFFGGSSPRPGGSGSGGGGGAAPGIGHTASQVFGGVPSSRAGAGFGAGSTPGGNGAVSTPMGAGGSVIRRSHGRKALSMTASAQFPYTPMGLYEGIVFLWSKLHDDHKRRGQGIFSPTRSEKPALRCELTSRDSNHYTATDVYLQSKKEPFSPRKDYLDMLMQFGYVCMFTAAWSLCPVAAFLNNILEIRGDAFKMMYGLQRPVPTFDADIGEWIHMFYRSAVWAIPVVVGLTVISTGQLEFWFEGHCNIPDASDLTMGPRLDCFSSWSVRLAIGIFLEHIMVAIVYMMQRMKNTTKRLDKKMHVKEVKRTLELQDKLLAPLAPEFKSDLKVIFRHHDTDNSRSLDRDEAAAMFTAMYAASLGRDGEGDGAGTGASMVRGAEYNEEQLEYLFGLLDSDSNGSIEFPEVVRAIRLAEIDPIVHNLFGMALAPNARVLAQSYLRREADMTRHGAVNDMAVPPSPTSGNTGSEPKKMR